jgi:D-alanine-D-alanine ligase
MARVALVFNLIRPAMLEGRPLDAVAELDTEETIAAIEHALAAGGHAVTRVEADEECYPRLRALRPDMVFNMAEGLRGESRESTVPAFCELLGLPYTASGVLTTALCLDKPRAKQVLAQHGIATPAWQVFEQAQAARRRELSFPLIVKLAHEGSSMGLSPASIVDDDGTLAKRVAYVLDTYHQPALVERYIEGREFTVGILGNTTLEILPIVEIAFDAPRGLNLFQPDEPVIAMAEKAGVTGPPMKPLHRAVIPAPVDEALAARIRATAVTAFRALDCRDVCRLEMRLGADDVLYVLELNPIAGLDPSYLLPRAAAAGGYSFKSLINRILDLAIERTCP